MYWRDKLKQQSKKELIDRIASLIEKTINQAIQLKQQSNAINKYKLKIKAYELQLVKTMPKNKKGTLVLDHYELLLRDYRLEISDLKDEIDLWKNRYVACLNKIIRKIITINMN